MQVDAVNTKLASIRPVLEPLEVISEGCERFQNWSVMDAFTYVTSIPTAEVSSKMPMTSAMKPFPYLKT